MSPNYFETDYGVVVIGPKFQALYSEHDDALKLRKNTKKYKFAMQSVFYIDKAITIMARANFLAGEVLETTP
jgi:hypothetical protein